MPAEPEGTSADTGRSGRGEGDLLFRPVVLAEVHLSLDGFIPGLAEGAPAFGPVLVEVVEAAEHIKEVLPVFIAHHFRVRRNTEGPSRVFEA